MSLSHGVKQALWLRQFLRDISIHLPKPPSGTEIFINNTGTIALAKEARLHAHMKHIDVHYHFVRERIEDGTFKITHVPTSKMLADGLTKALPRTGHEKMVKRLILTKV